MAKSTSGLYASLINYRLYIYSEKRLYAAIPSVRRPERISSLDLILISISSVPYCELTHCISSAAVIITNREENRNAAVSSACRSIMRGMTCGGETSLTTEPLIKLGGEHDSHQ